MNRLLIFIFSVLFVPMLAKAQQKDYSGLVDPFIESTKSRYFFFNSASRPFGMVNLSPDNILEKEWASGYRYQVNEIRGLTHIHDWGVGGILMMPTTGNIDYTKGPEEWKTQFSHDREIAKPGYHQVYFDKYDTNVELTSTTRVGFHQYTFEKSAQADVLLYLGGQLGSGIMKDANISVVSDQHVQGWVRQESMVGDVTLFFSIYYDKPFKALYPWSEKGRHDPLKPGQTIKENQLGASARFDVEAGEKIKVKVGVSWCGIEQAELNLQQELDHWDFERVVQESKDEWNSWLGRIEVEGGTRTQQVKFYTDLWRSLLGRRQIHDVNGKYPDYMSGALKVKQVPLDDKGNPKFMHLSTDALWMTMWNLNVLWGLAYPEVLSSFVQSSMLYFKDGGHLPRGPVIGRESWIMTSSPVSELIIGAYMLGIRDYDVNEVYSALKKAHMPGSTMDYGGGFVDKYIVKGYVPETVPAQGWGGAGRLMEYVTQDWALAQLAKELGKGEDYDYFLQRSTYWTNIFDPSIGFVRPRNEDGTWTEPFDPILNANFGGFVEANSWQTTWMAVHDIKGMVNVMGGIDAYCDKLNFGFEQARKDKFVGGYGGNYVNYSNQPGMVMAHLFNYAGKPWLSQYWVRQVYNFTFSDITPYGGYGGNDEDQGQMAALSALIGIGLFDVKGGTDPDPLYQVTAPLFDRVKINLSPKYYPGSTFEIVSENNGPDNVYIQNAKLNGAELHNNWFRQRDLIAGGILKLSLGDKPNKDWGFRDFPPSHTKGDPNIVISDLKHPTVVKSGDWIEVSYLVENKGSLGAHFGRIMQNGRVVAKNDSILRGLEAKTMNYRFRLFRDGQHFLELADGKEFSVHVKEKKSTLEVQELNLSVTGEKVHGAMTVLNNGSSSIRKDFSLNLGKYTVKKGKLTLNPGEETTLSFDYTVPKDGRYDLVFNGRVLRSVEVKLPQLRPEVDLALYYDFNDAKTPLLDLSGKGHYPQSERLPEVQFQEGVAVAVFERNNHLRIEHSPNISPTDQISIQMYIKPTDWYSFGRVLQKGNADNQYVILRNGGDELEFKVESVQNGLIKAKLPRTGEWVHLVFQYDGKTISIWQNGELLAEQPATGKIAVTQDPLFIGVKNERTGLEDSFRGVMSSIKIYEKAMDAEGIKREYLKAARHHDQITTKK